MAGSRSQLLPLFQKSESIVLSASLEFLRLVSSCTLVMFQPDELQQWKIRSGKVRIACVFKSENKVAQSVFFTGMCALQDLLDLTLGFQGLLSQDHSWYFEV